MVLVPAVLGGLSVLLLAAAVKTRRDGAVEDLVGSPPVLPPGASIRLHQRVVTWFGRLGWVRRVTPEETLRRRLGLAGLPDDIDRFIGKKVALAVGVGILAATLGTVLRMALAILPVSVAAGFRAPDVWLARRAKRRQEEMTRHVADLVDVLVATTEAGLSPTVALRRSAAIMRGPLGEELSAVIGEIDLGASWREALDRLLARTDAPPLRRLVRALTRSQRLGTSVGSSLRSVAGDLRAERRALAEETARRAPVKMLFPLVFLILPAFLLLTVGPAVLATLRSLH